MSYQYATERAEVFTESGQLMYVAIRDNAIRMLKLSGAVTCGKLTNAIGVSGSSWTMLACVDRLAELGEIVLVPRPGYATQDQVYVRGSLPL